MTRGTPTTRCRFLGRQQLEPNLESESTPRRSDPVEQIARLTAAVRRGDIPRNRATTGSLGNGPVEDLTQVLRGRVPNGWSSAPYRPPSTKKIMSMIFAPE